MAVNVVWLVWHVGECDVLGVGKMFKDVARDGS